MSSEEMKIRRLFNELRLALGEVGTLTRIENHVRGEISDVDIELAEQLALLISVMRGCLARAEEAAEGLWNTWCGRLEGEE